MYDSNSQSSTYFEKGRVFSDNKLLACVGDYRVMAVYKHEKLSCNHSARLL